MSVDQQKVMEAIYDLIYDSLTMVPTIGGRRPVANAAGSFLTLAFPGLPLDETQFTNPWSPTNPSGSIDAAESLAWLVDEVPQLSPLYSGTGNSVDMLYGQVVSANVQSTGEISSRPIMSRVSSTEPRTISAGVGISPRPQFQIGAVEQIRSANPIKARTQILSTLPQQFQDAHRYLFEERSGVDVTGKSIKTLAATPQHQEYLDKRDAHDAIMTQYMASRLQAQQGVAEDKARFTALEAKLEPQVIGAWGDLNSVNRSQVEGAQAALNDVINSSLASIFAEARLTYEMGKLASLIQPGAMWHQCLVSPQNWAMPSAVMAEVSLRSQSVRINSQSRFLLKDADKIMAGGLLRQRLPGAGWSSQLLSQETVDLNISFRFAHVKLRRLWLNSSLFSLSGWWLPGRSKNAFSTGTLINNDGIFSLLPTGMIVARDLKVTAQWANSDLTLITDSIRKGIPLSLGPFRLSGPLKQAKQAAALKQLDVQVEGMTISVPGLTILGYMNELLHAMPPLDG